MLNKIVDRRLEFLGLNDCQGCEVADIYSLADEVRFTRTWKVNHGK